jgi:hypothetical protein
VQNGNGVVALLCVSDRSPRTSVRDIDVKYEVSSFNNQPLLWKQQFTCVCII